MQLRNEKRFFFRLIERMFHSRLPVVLFIITNFQPSHSFLHFSKIGAKYSSSKTALSMKTIDSHLHVWASAAESTDYAYAPDQTPPDALIDISSTDSLLQQMSKAGVDGALIVQPINHKYDHRYVKDAMKKHPDKFKGMMLLDPSITDVDEAMSRFDELVLQGFIGVRFNPYLFEGKMSDNDAAVEVFKRCAELKFPVGIMCFKGIDLHYDDIIALCDMSPDTTVILDHFGFASVENQDQFDKVLSLKDRNVMIKISALFRLGDTGAPKYEKVRSERFEPLLKAYGANRLMFGTDFPFVTQEEIGYKGAVDTVSSWIDNEDDKVAVMGGTAERLFGVWDVS